MVMNTVFASYIAVSKRLGLAFENGRIHGAVDGIALQMWFGTYAVHVGGLLPTVAPIDLSIATKGLVVKLGALFGGHVDGIGDVAFDELFVTKSSNTSQVARILSAEARSMMAELAAEGYHPAIDAHSIHLR